MTYDRVAQAAMLREEVDRYEAVLLRLNFDVEDQDRRSIAIFRTIADDLDDLDTVEITDEDEARRITYEALTVVREVREDFEMVAERLGK